MHKVDQNFKEWIGVIWNCEQWNSFESFFFFSSFERELLLLSSLTEWYIISSSLEIKMPQVIFSPFFFFDLRLRDEVQPKTACIADCMTVLQVECMSLCISYQAAGFIIFVCILIKTVAGSQRIRRMHRKIIAKFNCFWS